MTPEQQAQAIRFIKWHISNRRGFNLRYKKATGDVTERAVLPFYITENGRGQVYVIGYDSLRRERRSFRLDRFLAIGKRDDKPAIEQSILEQLARWAKIEAPVGKIIAKWAGPARA